MILKLIISSMYELSSEKQRAEGKNNYFNQGNLKKPWCLAWHDARK